jgi:hypothetical protein
MLDNITLSDRVVRVIEIAQREAGALGQQFGTEHILLALIQEGCGFAYRALCRHQVFLDATRIRVRSLPPSCEESVESDLANLNKVLSGQSERSGGSSVDTRDLLLGLLHDTNNRASRVLSDLGVSIEDLRKTVEEGSMSDILPLIPGREMVVVKIPKDLVDDVFDTNIASHSRLDGSIHPLDLFRSLGVCGFRKLLSRNPGWMSHRTQSQLQA